MNQEPQSDEAFEQMLKEKLEPRPPGWETNRTILETLVLKDPEEITRSSRKKLLQYGWIASVGVIAAAFIAAFTITQIDQSALDSEAATQGAPIQLGRQSVAAAEPSPVNLKAVGATQRLVGVKDMGWKNTEDGNATRAFKYEYIDTVDLVNEEDGSVMRVEVPRQEIVNVKYQLI
jgi:hypothetical protein